MGGFNSGRRSGRPTVEAGFPLDVSRLLRHGTIRTGCVTSGSIVWSASHSGERRATIGYEADLTNGDAGRMRLRYAVDGKPQDYWVRLTTTPCHFGGRRWWFLCPSSGRRCGKLHLPPGGTIFAARQAYCLAYRSQRQSEMDRSHTRLSRLHRMMGGQYEYADDPPPARPKWMRQRTYNRLVAEWEAAMERHDDIWMAGATSLLAKRHTRD